MIEDPAELGRQQAQAFIACITGQSGSPAFWPTLDSDIEQTKRGPESFWRAFHLGHLARAQQIRDDGIAARGRRHFDRLAEINRITAEIPLLEAAVARATDDEFGSAYAEVLSRYAEGLRGRLEQITGSAS